ncbi:leukocyte antigen CD37 isoform X2 [Hemicordylus capensis]|uniref:leukocyte antigen CD37 isoform X2 n=1 Tax=Hemicordylus capensis TaxID=884348 RepID=UPI00230315BF|nr:leukocyte antigen CD37 isoform X2 [Hemicordylus capensis]
MRDWRWEDWMSCGLNVVREICLSILVKFGRGLYRDGGCEGTMSHKGCLSVTKYFLFIFNLFFFILGSLLFSFGLWILFDQSSFASALGSTYYALKVWSYIFSGVGIFTMLLGFLGCLGSLKEIKCMLGFYFAFLLLLFVAQITIGILIYTQRNTLSTTVGRYVEDIIANYGSTDILPDREESWDFVQKQLQCCGWTSYDDWQSNIELRNNQSSGIYPCSCHNISQSGLMETNHTVASKPFFCKAQGASGFPSVYTKGCKDSVEIWLTNNIISIVGICLGIALMELCLMTLSMFLCRTLGPNYDKLTRYY